MSSSAQYWSSTVWLHRTSFQTKTWKLTVSFSLLAWGIEETRTLTKIQLPRYFELPATSNSLGFPLDLPIVFSVIHYGLSQILEHPELFLA